MGCPILEIVFLLSVPAWLKNISGWIEKAVVEIEAIRLQTKRSNSSRLVNTPGSSGREISDSESAVVVSDSKVLLINQICLSKYRTVEIAGYNQNNCFMDLGHPFLFP